MVLVLVEEEEDMVRRTRDRGAGSGMCGKGAGVVVLPLLPRRCGGWGRPLVLLLGGTKAAPPA